MDPANNIHPEFDGYAGQTIKQADVTLLQYPWNVPMSASMAQNDLDYYGARTDANGPSMTDAIATIAGAKLGSPGCASTASLLNSATPFLTAPFHQWRDPLGGAFTFTTGRGRIPAGVPLRVHRAALGDRRRHRRPVPAAPAARDRRHRTEVAGPHLRPSASASRQTTLTLRARCVATSHHGRRSVTRTVQPSGSTWQTATRRPANVPRRPTWPAAKTITGSSADPSYPAVGAVDGTDATSWNATANRVRA